MGKIRVEGLGIVNIKGDEPTIRESFEIKRALEGAQAPVGIPQPGTFQEERTPARRIAAAQHDVTEGARRAVHPGMLMAGGGGGAAAGFALTAGNPVGMLEGGMLGAAGAEFGFQAMNDYLVSQGFRSLPGGIPQDLQGNERVGEGARRALNEAALEGITQGVAPLTMFIRHGITPLLGKIMGTRDEAARAMIEMAERQGVKLGAVDAGKAVPKGMAKVLGIFPFTGTPVRTHQRAAMEAIDENVVRTLNNLAPTATTAGEIGVDMEKAARGASKEFYSVTGKMYDNFRELARTIDVPSIPTRATREMIGKYVDDFRLGDINVGSDAPQVLKVEHTEAFENFLEQARNLPEHITVDQYRRLQEMFESFVDTASPDGFTLKRVAEIKAAMEGDLMNIGKGVEEAIDPELLQQVRALKEEADSLWSTGMLLFQRPAAKRLSRLDRNLFRAGPERPGTIDSDQLFSAAFKTDSADTIRDLRILIGDDVFNNARRLHFNNAINSATETVEIGGTKVETFSLDKFAKNLGLLDGQKPRLDALEEMLKGSGVTVRDIQELVAGARVFEAADPSTFMKRRVILGGLEGLMAAGGAGAALMTGNVGFAGAAGITVGARMLSHAISSPSFLKKMNRAFLPDLSVQQQRQLLLRLAREIGIETEQRATGEQRRPGPLGPRPTK